MCTMSRFRVDCSDASRAGHLDRSKRFCQIRPFGEGSRNVNGLPVCPVGGLVDLELTLGLAIVTHGCPVGL